MFLAGTRRSGSASSKLLARATWAVAVGGDDHVLTIDDFEATTSLLTGVLYTIAQLPGGCRDELLRLREQLDRLHQI